MKLENIQFKSLLKEIASHANVGRLYEAGKKSPVPPKPEEKEHDELNAEPVGADSSADTKAPSTPEVPSTPPQPEAPEEPVQEPEPEKDTPEEDSIESTEKAEAEDAIENVSFIKLNSDTGIKFLLNSIIQPAIETNTLDSIAQDFAEKLNIKTTEDLNKFKDSSIQFKSVVGFDQILTAMESFVNG